MASLFDLLSEKDKKTVREWAEERSSPKRKTAIPPELYTVAELGYYLGWGAVEACIRGYIDYIDDDGTVRKAPFTLEQHIALVKACQKVWYRKLIDRGDIITRANIASRAQNPNRAFRENFSGYEREAAI